ncbi:hypothetical protein, partial [Nocardia altamirensis]|uniref:hypothetical protein n=1 Tax=Nocardia altamirensis TaxID=472158 RepID=UPI001C3FDDC7
MFDERLIAHNDPDNQERMAGESPSAPGESTTPQRKPCTFGPESCTHSRLFAFKSTYGCETSFLRWLVENRAPALKSGTRSL